jgi:hypothetical protein
LLQKEIPGRIDDVVAVEIENTPGQLSKLIAKLMDADIKIRYSYASASINQGKRVMIFCFSDNDKAIQVLTEKQIRPLDYNSIAMLEAAA